VLLHRALQGRTVAGEAGASVSIRTPDDEVVPMVDWSPECVGGLVPGRPDSLQVEVTCYSTDVLRTLRIEPGATYELEVLSAAGERLRGRTTVPNDFLLRRPSYPGTVSFPA